MYNINVCEKWISKHYSFKSFTRVNASRLNNLRTSCSYSIVIFFPLRGVSVNINDKYTPYVRNTYLHCCFYIESEILFVCHSSMRKRCTDDTMKFILFYSSWFWLIIVIIIPIWKTVNTEEINYFCMMDILLTSLHRDNFQFSFWNNYTITPIGACFV